MKKQTLAFLSLLRVRMSYPNSQSYSSYSSSYTNTNSFYKRGVQRTPPVTNDDDDHMSKQAKSLAPPSNHHHHESSNTDINKEHADADADAADADEIPMASIDSSSTVDGFLNMKSSSTRRRTTTTLSSTSTSSKISIGQKEEQHNMNGDSTSHILSESHSSSLQRDSKGKPIHQNKHKRKGKWSFNNSRIEIPVAVLLWYLLGVLSISTTKVLLTDYQHLGMTPLFLTVQQLFIGAFFLRLWIFVKNGIPPHPMPMPMSMPMPMPISFKQIVYSFSEQKANNIGYNKLFLSATFFTLGFWLTNLSFSGADASFVETIKASEPISSAGLAVWYGLEVMSSKEVYSLLGICAGVVISTLGNAHAHGHGDASAETLNLISNAGNAVALMQSVYSSGIVLGANVCFSFRGLYQKLFRQSGNGSKALVDDLNLQYRVHQIGLLVMFLPLCLYELPTFIRFWLNHSAFGFMFMTREELQKMFVLIVINGFAFTHYKYVTLREKAIEP